MGYIRNKKVIIKLGNRIRELRKKQKISQAQLAFEAGIPRMQIVRIETGKINTSVSVITAIADALNVHPKFLLDFEWHLNK